MARKGKNKKKQRKKQTYNKTEFKEVFCQTCLICQASPPEFCYSYLYKNEAKSFVNKVFNNLIDVHAFYQASARPMKSISIEQFQNVVCRTGVCFDGDVYASASCDRTKECYSEFQIQMGMPIKNGVIHEVGAGLIEFKNNTSKKNIISYKKKKKKKKHKHRYVCESYPTFFCRDDDEFKATVRRILYGDNDIEQNSDQKLSASITGEAGGDSESGESKV